MITPMFHLSQDHNFVIAHIKAPYSNVSEVDIYINDNDFKFYAKPYFLRLNLPGAVVDNELARAQYIADEGAFIVHMPKATPGEKFEGLDLITKLLAPKDKPLHSGVPLIEVIGNNENNSSPEPDDEEFDWSVPQTPCNDDSNDTLVLSSEGYGFANQYQGVIAKFQDELPDIVDIKDPDSKSLFIRSKERIEAEANQFSDDHYLADFYEDEEIVKLMEYQPHWSDLCKKLEQTGSSPDELITFSEEERDMMRKLPNKEYLLDKAAKTKLLFGLVDILYAYAYNVRITEGEHTVGSPWTICKLSASLSWFETFKTLFSTVVTCVRRSLCYPLYRHWGLSMTVIKDACDILRLGQKYVLRCLLDICNLLKDSDSHFVLNDLYITDYCIWIQTVKSKTLLTLAEELTKVKVKKEDVELDLIELHIAARLALEEQGNIHVTNVHGKSLEERTEAVSFSNPSEACVLNPHADADQLSSELTKLTLSEAQACKSTSSLVHSSLENQELNGACLDSPSDSSSEEDSSLTDSGSDSSSDRSDSDSTTDSDDYSSSDIDSSDSDDDDDSSSDTDESCLLLKKIKSSERKR